MKNYFGVDFEKQREALLQSEVARPIIEGVIEKADKALGVSYSNLKMSEFMLYYENGNRSVFEKKYYERRNNCAALCAALWLTGDKK